LQANREWWITDREGKSYRATGAALKLGKSGVVPHDSPVAWDGKFVVFSAANGDSRNLWRLSLFGPFGFLISGPEVITTGSGFQAVPAILADGRVAYADWRRQTHIWRIDSSGTGKSVQVTVKTSEDAGVSASTDGRRIVFVRIRGKSRDVWLKDMQSGIERELLPGEPAIPLLAPGGEQVAISIGKQILLLDVASGRRTTLLENAGEILAWTPDGTALLYVDVRDTHRHAIVRVNIYSKKRQILLEGGGLHHAAYSPDGKSLAASVRDDSSHSRIVLADVKSDGSVGEWNSITDNGYWAERPVWSANGRVVYFVTDKDGFWCVFGQEVNAASLEVIGAPAALTHLHAATSSLSHLVDATSGMARIGKDILLCIGSEHSNIWAVRP
jgi:Tol biopolymer transport system component